MCTRFRPQLHVPGMFLERESALWTVPMDCVVVSNGPTRRGPSLCKLQLNAISTERWRKLSGAFERAIDDYAVGAFALLDSSGAVGLKV